MEREKFIRELFQGKVSEEIGVGRTAELLNQSISAANKIDFESTSTVKYEEIKALCIEFKNKELPDSDKDFHFEAEIWSGMQSFLRFVKNKNQNKNNEQ